MESLEAVPVDVCHLHRLSWLLFRQTNLVGYDSKKESHKFLCVFVPRRRIGAVDVVEGNLDILAPVGVFAFIMEVAIVA